tara:strand:+ start:4770 stop:5537 length:768 start_codon:yes stop_codon:yes gene_type:complete
MYPRVMKSATYGRWIEIAEGTFVPSVTTMISGGTPMSPWLLEYIIKQSKGDYDKYKTQKSEAMLIGTKIHKYIEDLLKGEEVINLENEVDGVKKGLLCFKKWFEEYKPEIIAVEEFLYCDELKDGALRFPFAGTPDLICKIGKEVYLVDFKSSNQLDANMGTQLSCYKTLWDVNHDVKIDKLAVVWCRKNFMGNGSRVTPKSLFKEYNYDPKDVYSCYYQFKKFHGTADGVFNPKPKVEYPDELTLDVDIKWVKK